MRTAEISAAGQTACVVRSPLSGRRLHRTRPTGRLTPIHVADLGRNGYHVAWFRSVKPRACTPDKPLDSGRGSHSQVTNPPSSALRSPGRRFEAAGGAQSLTNRPDLNSNPLPQHVATATCTQRLARLRPGTHPQGFGGCGEEGGGETLLFWPPGRARGLSDLFIRPARDGV
jgi:hypothetical protein